MGHPGLCHENVLRLQLVFETWRWVRTKARARDLIGGLLNQDRAILFFLLRDLRKDFRKDFNHR